MLAAALSGLPTPIKPAGALVPVRYVGPKPEKRDTLFGTKLRWRGTGDVQQVPEHLAKLFLKMPGVWRLASEPWHQPQVQAPDDLLDLVKNGDWEDVRRVAPAVFDNAIAFFLDLHRKAEPAVKPAPLNGEDASRLSEFVPGLARALVQGVSDSVFAKIDFVRPLLDAYPPLLAGCIEAERDGKARRDVMRRLEGLAAELLPVTGAVQADLLSTATDEPIPPADTPDPIDQAPTEAPETPNDYAQDPLDDQ